MIGEEGYNHYCGLDEDVYEALNDLIINVDNIDTAMYYDDAFFMWVELSLCKECKLSTEDVIDISSSLGDILFKNLNRAKRDKEVINSLKDLIEYMQINYPIDWKNVNNKINILNSLFK